MCTLLPPPWSARLESPNSCVYPSPKERDGFSDGETSLAVAAAADRHAGAATAAVRKARNRKEQAIGLALHCSPLLALLEPRAPCSSLCLSLPSLASLCAGKEGSFSCAGCELELGEEEDCEDMYEQLYLFIGSCATCTGSSEAF